MKCHLLARPARGSGLSSGSLARSCGRGGGGPRGRRSSATGGRVLCGAVDFDLSADQVALRDAAAGLLDDRCGMDVVRRACDSGGFDADLWGAMVEQGWTGIAVPEALGGVGLGTVEAAVLLEQTGAHLAPVPLLQQLAALAALAEGPWGERLLSGEAVACVARTPLERAGDGSVSGRPEPVIYGSRADVLVAPATATARTPMDDMPAPADDELVAVDLAGVARSPEPAMDQTRELAWIELGRRSGRQPLAAQRRWPPTWTGARCSTRRRCWAPPRTVMSLAVEYAKVREQFGRPIGSFQAVKHRCADMLVDVEGMRSAVYHAAWALGAAGPDAPGGRGHGQDLVQRRRGAGGRVGAAGPRRHRLHLGGRCAPVSQAGPARRCGLRRRPPPPGPPLRHPAGPPSRRSQHLARPVTQERLAGT